MLELIQLIDGYVYKFVRIVLVAWLTDAEPHIKWLPKTRTGFSFVFWSLLKLILKLVFNRTSEQNSDKLLLMRVGQFEATGCFSKNIPVVHTPRGSF